MYLSVVIGAYNEEKRITATLKETAGYLARQNYDYEVIVVSDGSKDATVKTVRNFQKEMPFLKIIDNKENHGKGFVVKQGMLAAAGETRLFMDADNATIIDNLDQMLPWLEKGYEVVIASIGVKGAKIVGREKFYKRFLGKISNMIIQVLAVPGIHDTQRGFKLFTKRSALEIFKRVTIPRWGFDIEVLALARKFGFKIKEVPVVWDNDPNSKVNIWAYPKTFLDAVRVRWNLWTGKYK